MSHFELMHSHVAYNLEVLWDIFIQISKDPSSGTIICIIDALDECKEPRKRDQFLGLLTRHYQPGRMRNEEVGSVRFLITSRTQVPITDSLVPVPMVRLGAGDEIDNVSKDIATVVKVNLQRMVAKYRCSETAREMVEEHLLKNHDRTFLWVSLVLRMLEDSASTCEAEFEDILKRLPDGLEEVYSRILDGVPEKYERQVKQILGIVVVAVRPLTLKEMNMALAVLQSTASDDISRRLEPNIENTINKMCGAFVRIIRNKVYLIHQTAKEFLVRSSSHDPPTAIVWKHSLDPATLNILISDICIRYLHSDALDDCSIGVELWKANNQKHGTDKPEETRARAKQAREQIKEYDLVLYAAEHWAIHFRNIKTCTKATSLESMSRLEQVLSLCDTRSKRFWTWFQLYWRSITWKPYPLGLSPIMVASYIGHGTAVRCLLERRVNVTERDHRGWTALHWAASAGHESTAKLLLDYGLDPVARNKYESTALNLAIENEQPSVILLLLGREVDFAATSEGHDTPLQQAVKKGSSQLARLLLHKGADPTAVNGLGWSALDVAITEKSEAMIRLFLSDESESVGEVQEKTMFPTSSSKGLSVGRPYKYIKISSRLSPLEQAVNIGNKQVVELLLNLAVRGGKHKIGLVQRNGVPPGRKAWDIACRRNQKEMIDLLREYGIGLHKQDQPIPFTPRPVRVLQLAQVEVKNSIPADEITEHSNDDEHSFQFWSCCKCHSGPYAFENDSLCTECEHIFCSYYLQPDITTISSTTSLLSELAVSQRSVSERLQIQMWFCGHCRAGSMNLHIDANCWNCGNCRDGYSVYDTGYIQK
ncbi:MAG: hypothetical protein Q9187_005077 [Circinaria calcarea]